MDEIMRSLELARESLQAVEYALADIYKDIEKAMDDLHALENDGK